MPNKSIYLTESQLKKWNSIENKSEIIQRALMLSGDKWYNDQNVLVSFGSYLIDNEIVENIHELQYFYEKPWKYEKHYLEYAKEQTSRD